MCLPLYDQPLFDKCETCVKFLTSNCIIGITRMWTSCLGNQFTASGRIMISMAAIAVHDGLEIVSSAEMKI